MSNIKIAYSFVPLAVVAASVLSACSASSTQNSIEPAITSQNNPVTQSSLAFAVGTANIAGNATLGLNSVVTLRQTAGNVGASILANAPTILGPASFVVPASAPDAFTDAGTNHISGNLITSVVSSPALTTFDPNGNANVYGIASSMGIIPAGAVNPASNPSLLPYPLPFYASSNTVLTAVGAALASKLVTGVAAVAPAPLQLYYIGGAPTFVAAGHNSTQDGTFAGNPPGYQLGFTDFQAVPTAGTYTLNVVIPTGISSATGASGTGIKTATAALNSAHVLPAWNTAPTFTPDGNGGGTITVNFPGGGGVTEEYVELVDLGVLNSGTPTWPCATSGSGPYYYTFKVALGAATVAVPDNLGAAVPGSAGGPTICSAASNTTAVGSTTAADDYAVYGFAVDWPLDALVAAEVANANVPAPLVTGQAGTDDITTSGPSFSATITAPDLSGSTLLSHLRTRPIMQRPK